MFPQISKGGACARSLPGAGSLSEQSASYTEAGVRGWGERGWFFRVKANG